jgi:DNA-binding SARP family transcriptional activator
LLAYLAMHGQSARNTLAALLWPDAEPDGARNNLRQMLFKLRKSARQDLVVGTTHLSVAPGVLVDANESSPAERQLLEGYEYADCPEFAAWLDAERTRLDRLWLDGAAAEAAALENAGQFDVALRVAEDIVRRMPLEELGHRRLIRLHYLRGDRAAALAAYEQCAEKLRRELDIAPSEETRLLAASLEAGLAPAPTPARAVVPVTLSRPPRLIGREHELEALDRAWQERRAFVVVGDPGLGKSRLLAEFAADRSGVLVAAARPGDSGIPYASLARILRLVIERIPMRANDAWRDELPRLLPELGPGRGGAIKGQRLSLQRALVALLKAAIAKALSAVILDDLHFADEASVEMLHSLVSVDGLDPLSWGFAQRPAEGGAAARALRDALGDASALVEVPIMPLDVAQMAKLVDCLAIPGLEGEFVAEQLVRFTGGNPLFALETLKDALAAGASCMQLREGRLPRPMNVGALIDRRLKQLSPGALALARVAAIAGSDFDAELAAHVLRTNELALADAWNELEAGQVLKGAAFAHDLVFESTLRSVPAPIAQQTHRRIAQFLEPKGGEPARLAEHWTAAGEADRAVSHFKAAAVRAEAAARFGDARLLLERAIAITEAAGLKTATLDLQFLLVELLKDIGAPGETLSIVERMHGNVTTADERMRLARSEAEALAYLGRYTQAESTARRALDDSDCVEDANPLRVAEVRYALAENLLVSRRVPEALELLALVEMPLRNHPDPQFRGWFHSAYARALLLSDRLAQADQQLDAGLEIARQVGRQRMICGMVAMKGQVAAAAGLIHEPLQRFHEAQLAVADMEPSVITMALQYWLATSLTDIGRYREALASIEGVLATPAQTDDSWHARGHGQRALIYGHLGQRRLAAQSQAEADRFQSVPMSIPANVVTRFELDWILEAPLGERIERGRAEIAQVGTLSVHWRLALAEALSRPEAIDAKAMESLQRSAIDHGLLGHALAARLALAVAAARSGDAGACVDNAAAVLKGMRRYTLPGSYRPRLWLICYELLREFDPELGGRALRDGADWIRAVARFNVPEPFRDGFLHRNPVNRSLLLAADRIAEGR